MFVQNVGVGHLTWEIHPLKPFVMKAGLHLIKSNISQIMIYPGIACFDWHPCLFSYTVANIYVSVSIQQLIHNMQTK
jgi:hypothetical protein